MNFFTPVIAEHIKKSVWLANRILFFCRKCETLTLLPLVVGQNLFRKAEANVNCVVGYFCCRTRKCRTSDDLPDHSSIFFSIALLCFLLLIHIPSAPTLTYLANGPIGNFD